MTATTTRAAGWQASALATLDASAQRWVDDAHGIVWRRWGRGPAVVLLHGSAGSWTHWLRNIASLAEGHTVLVPDLPGNGDSPPFDGPVTVAAVADAVHASLRRSGEAAGPYALVGFSLGSFVAETLALRHPSSVRRLVLVRGSFDDAGRPMPAGLVRWRHLLDDPAALREAHRHNLATLMVHDPARIDDAAVELHGANQLRARLDVMALMASREAGVLQRLASAPQCVMGAHDVLGDGDAPAQRQALHAARPDAGFHVIDDAGHWAIYEQAGPFNALLTRLLQD